MTSARTLTAGRSSDYAWGAFGFALMVVYWPNISGVATTPRWDVAALLALPLFFAPKLRMTPSHWVGLALIGWLLLTLAWDESRLDGVDMALKLAVAGVAFAVGSSLETLKPLFVGASLGLSVNSVIAVLQWCGLSPLPIDSFAGGYAGLFYNRDRLAAAAALVAVGLCGLRQSTGLLLSVSLSLVMTQSRAAWLAVAAGLLTLKSPLPFALWPVRALAIAGVIVTFAWRALDGSIDDRLALWHDTLASLSIQGHGLGSFYESFPHHAQWFAARLLTQRPDHPHNEWLSLAWDGGAVAVGLFAVLGVLVYRATDHGLRATLVSLFVLSLFAMPLHDPATLVLGSCVAGFCAGLGGRLRNAAHACGSPLCEGVAARVYARRHA